MVITQLLGRAEYQNEKSLLLPLPINHVNILFYVSLLISFYSIQRCLVFFPPFTCLLIYEFHFAFWFLKSFNIRVLYTPVILALGIANSNTYRCSPRGMCSGTFHNSSKLDTTCISINRLDK